MVLIEGEVVGFNSIRSGRRDLLPGKRIILCWANQMQSAVTPQPLDLTPYMGQVILVSGSLHGDLWEAQFERVLLEEGYQEISGEVTDISVIEGPDGPVSCLCNGKQDIWLFPLNLTEYLGKTITVAGELVEDVIYTAHIIETPKSETDKDPSKEAKSLNDLLRIRANNRDKIEAINENLGNALGFKWSNGVKTAHPAVIIFVPKKISSWLIPEEEKAPDILEAADGTWCFTDVVTGGKTTTGGFESLPELTEINKRVILELQSGRIGLIGGIQLTCYENGIQDEDHSTFGTAGIAVRHLKTGKVGFLTNKHVADVRGRKIYHPEHGMKQIGVTYETLEYVNDEAWYNNIIDEEYSFVLCDSAFVPIDNNLLHMVRPGLHVIGETGPLLRIDPDTMDIIGQKVISIGRTRGVQRGTIVAYAYEFNDELRSEYTDLLIIGEDGSAFSGHGDSGKIIVTDDEEHRPVGLLWGGGKEQLRHGHRQEIWTFAVDLGKVMDRLGLELFA